MDAIERGRLDLELVGWCEGCRSPIVHNPKLGISFCPIHGLEDAPGFQLGPYRVVVRSRSST